MLRRRYGIRRNASDKFSEALRTIANYLNDYYDSVERADLHRLDDKRMIELLQEAGIPIKLMKTKREKYLKTPEDYTPVMNGILLDVLLPWMNEEIFYVFTDVTPSEIMNVFEAERGTYFGHDEG